MIIALGLMSGGLDSILAARLLQEQQQLQVEAVTFITPFFGPEKARAAAAQLSIRLHEVDITDSHFAMLLNPKHGYGKHMNPCIDCHAMMFREAAHLLTVMQVPGFLFSGEVLGERPMSQNRRSLETVARESGSSDIILRPLSARLLPPTRPEIEGLVQRDMLLDIQGRSRKPQLALAKKWGITQFPNPGGGCLLTDPLFSRRLRDLLDHQTGITRTDLELLSIGRHLRIRPDLKIIVGRDEANNERLESTARQSDVVITLADIPGPTVLVPGNPSRQDCLLAARVCVSFSSARTHDSARAILRRSNADESVTAAPLERSRINAWLI